MRICIRIDDVSPGLDRAKFSRFLAMAEKAGLTILLGVVPEARDPKLMIDPPAESFFGWVKELEGKGHVLSMHGVYHVYTTKAGGLFPLNRQSEFAGLSEERQRELLSEGKRILSSNGIDTDLFMAPAHSFDGATLKILRELGFTGLTDGFGKGPYLWRGLTFYPISENRQNCLRGGEGITTFVVHPNVMEESDFSFYEKLFSHELPGEYELVPYQAMLREPAVKAPAFAGTGIYLRALFKRTAVQLLSALRR